jgi:hypothetical protein
MPPDIPAYCKRFREGGSDIHAYFIVAVLTISTFGISF